MERMARRMWACTPWPSCADPLPALGGLGLGSDEAERAQGQDGHGDVRGHPVCAGGASLVQDAWSRHAYFSLYTLMSFCTFGFRGSDVHSCLGGAAQPAFSKDSTPTVGGTVRVGEEKTGSSVCVALSSCMDSWRKSLRAFLASRAAWGQVQGL